MSSGYLATEDIFVFPSARRMNKQVSARLVSEASLANIVNKLIETDGFVITPEPEQPESTDPDYNIKLKYCEQGFTPSESFEFNVHGYYFNAVSANAIYKVVFGNNYTFDSPSDSETDKIYANIYLDKTTDPNYVELKVQEGPINELDVENRFKGVTFSDTDLTTASPTPADYSLLLFEKELFNGGTYEWVVPIESRLKFIYTFALGVDGGEITKDGLITDKFF